MKTTKLLKLIARKFFSPLEEDGGKASESIVSTPELGTPHGSAIPSLEVVNQLVSEIHHNPFTYAMRAQLLRPDIREIELVSMAKTIALLFRLQRLGCHGIELRFKFDDAGEAPWQHCWLQWSANGRSYRLDPLFFDQVIDENAPPYSAESESQAESAEEEPVLEESVPDPDEVVAEGQLALAS